MQDEINSHNSMHKHTKNKFMQRINRIIFTRNYTHQFKSKNYTVPKIYLRIFLDLCIKLGKNQGSIEGREEDMQEYGPIPIKDMPPPPSVLLIFL